MYLWMDITLIGIADLILRKGEKVMKTFEMPAIEVVRFDVEDIMEESIIYGDNQTIFC